MEFFALITEWTWKHRVLIGKWLVVIAVFAIISGSILYYGHTRYKAGEAKLQSIVTQQKVTISDLRSAAKTNIDSLNACTAQNRADAAKYKRTMDAQAAIANAEREHATKVERELANLKATAPKTRIWANDHIPNDARQKGAELVQ